MGGYQTKQRARLIQFLEAHADEALTVDQIAASIDGISASSVYRNISALTEQKKVVRSLSADGHTAVYQYRDRVRCALHLHLRCVTCGRVTHLSNALSQALADRIEGACAFCVDTQTTVINGQCILCRDAERRGAD